MNTDLDIIAKKVDRLEHQNRRLKIATYRIWPVVWTATVIFVVIPGRLDETAVRTLLGWMGGAFSLLVIGLVLFLVLSFLLKLAADFMSRNSRFTLNPGSQAQASLKDFQGGSTGASGGDHPPG